MLMTRRHVLAASAGTLVAAPITGRAQEALPDVMRVIVSVPAGNSIDSSARVFAEAYRIATGRKCYVENKTGAAGTIAATEVSRAKPDGSVLLWTTGGHTTTAVLMKKLPYDPVEGFTPMTPVSAGDGFALITRAASPLNSVQDVIDIAKKTPGKLTYASGGIGNTTHVVGALFAKYAGIDLTHVPYRSDFLPDLIAGVTDMMFSSPAVLDPFIKDGQLKLIGISSPRRSERYPDLPTFSEFAVPDIGIPAYSALLAPPNMPPATLATLHEGITQALRSQLVAANFSMIGNRVWTLSPQEFKTYLQNEVVYYQRVLPPLGIQMNF
ncbi:MULTISPECIES: tripartite tricarboxylate transporter substrate binding protein [unclassified Beijerinckia]|uniref:Bug family tripartite tricarboxylate transporter substrate binding protein n=1 Tax=unclassified Beijerinckia TaxID=2638183 RepID=UPI00089962E4|nr:MULTISPECIES: tripartite tricarboxylate transporter substrate binding protein [unclassified Beijerinckia]MDH7796213.1 tripartite-type tricarboxylate transporter receptor subunit TctC [Beijerinckia sp. GAS462]SEC35329.1 Tripartite-type tricarboxylate transporter, receptor component TctC [Beijerinckia sp. 28-YEA-48]